MNNDAKGAENTVGITTGRGSCSSSHSTSSHCTVGLATLVLVVRRGLDSHRIRLRSSFPLLLSCEIVRFLVFLHLVLVMDDILGIFHGLAVSIGILTRCCLCMN